MERSFKQEVAKLKLGDGETFHGDLKHNQGIRRLSVRGLPRASGEWAFATAVRNLRKAITSGHLTAASLAALAR